MSVVVRFSVPGTHFSLAEPMRDVPGLRAEMDRVVPLGECVMPILWAFADGERAFDAFEKALDARSRIERVLELDQFEDRRLYRIEWTPKPGDVVAQLTETQAIVLSAGGTVDRWEFEVRFPDQRAVSSFQRRCEEHGIRFDVRSIGRLRPDAANDYGLTPDQRSTLVRAYESGFYRIPRAVTSTDLAAELGISDQSLSERLRRAHASLVRNTLR